ncbi:acetyl-CoA carboxylase family protein [Pseudonocardia nigra]|uniref:acetyl-CoA carboxylase family protein n=1 Tax=Pseudonocardia nigra TaxID=1921578 RepID=UPI0027E25AA0|nr:carboxyl transferase domain-containing protein [Pseudonocardia nigra]
MSPPGLTSLLVANRGEIAVRVLRAAAELGVHTVAVHAEDDGGSFHTRLADENRALRGTGAAAYLDAEQLVQVARDCGCAAVHPGYGFLSEDPRFATLCGKSGLAFVGPRPDVLELFGDKTRGRALAQACGVPVLAGTSEPTPLADAQRFLESLPDGAAVMVKAVAGGGGRGIRAVRTADELADAYARCAAMARAAFGNDALYVERYLERARHVEVQIVGDGSGAVSHLWERDCSIQRQHQKLVEVTPAPGLPSPMRDRLLDAAVRMAAEVSYGNAGTVEFLVDPAGDEFFFIEANPRLQVEHTVTEELLGIDLVQAQLRLTAGAALHELGLDQGSVPASQGFAMQVRVNMETMAPDGTARPADGTLRIFQPPSGRGIRVDTFGYAGYEPSPHYDSLLAKLVVRTASDRFADVAGKAYRALSEFRIDGIDTNTAFLQSLLSHPEFTAGHVWTGFLAEHMAELVSGVAEHQPLFVAPQPAPAVRVDRNDPLAVLHHGKTAAPAASSAELGAGAIAAPIRGTVASVDVTPGDSVRAGQQVLVIEAMKMEHVVAADVSGVVRRLAVAAGDTVAQGDALLQLEESDVEHADTVEEREWDPEEVRPDLAEVIDRHRYGHDEARPDAVARRRRTGQRTARENVDDLCDPGTFLEYGPLVIAGQRRRRPLQELIEKTPADGLLTGIGDINGRQTMVLAYDYTVFAGTQGGQNHRKKDRMFALAEQWQLPVVFFTEGGGGRPGDTDGSGVAHLDVHAFHYFARLSGLVPLVGINSGRCFAGNAALLGCCDVVIATADSTIGMGGPAMIEGGGLGIYRPEEVGPMSVQVPNGVVDIPVADEAEAVRVAKQYLSYFQGPQEGWQCDDQRRLRSLIPENRLRTYDVEQVIRTLADTDSVLELRRDFGRGMVTALARIEGKPLGIVANNPTQLAGAVDADGADKAARFLQLCDAFDLPILFLCDTPGIMVGPDAERTAQVRHVSRMFVVGASLTVPFCTIVLRKAYGLGAQTMAGGSFHAPRFAVSWPTGEFGGMGIEGAVKLGYRHELAAIKDPRERKEAFDRMVAERYEQGKAVNTASHFELDDVIDPMDSRRWVLSALRSPAPVPVRSQKKRPCIDTW